MEEMQLQEHPPVPDAAEGIRQTYPMQCNSLSEDTVPSKRSHCLVETPILVHQDSPYIMNHDIHTYIASPASKRIMYQTLFMNF